MYIVNELSHLLDVYGSNGSGDYETAKMTGHPVKTTGVHLKLHS